MFQKCVAAVIFCIAWIHGISGGSYSKVYVNMGTNAGPYQYISYGAPPITYGRTLAELSAPPAQSVPPNPQPANFAPPCVIPCVPVSQQTVSQYDTNAPIVSYTVPSAPIVVSGNVPSNYQYSYIVYDDGTGDQKAASELSDGGVVRGRYSFLQPDGYVREVQYTADDVTGFNAVVNYLTAGGDPTVEVKGINPCPDTKPEAIKQETSEKQPAEKSSTTTASPSIQVTTGSIKITPKTTKSPAVTIVKPTERTTTVSPKVTPKTTTAKTTSPKEIPKTTTAKPTEKTTKTATTIQDRTTKLSPKTTTKKMEVTTKTPTTISMDKKTSETPTTMRPKAKPITTEKPTTTISTITKKKVADKEPTTVKPNAQTTTAKVTEKEPKKEKAVPAVVQTLKPPQPVVVKPIERPQPVVVQPNEAPQPVVVQPNEALQPVVVQPIEAPQPDDCSQPGLVQSLQPPQVAVIQFGQPPQSAVVQYGPPPQSAVVQYGQPPQSAVVQYGQPPQSDVIQLGQPPKSTVVQYGQPSQSDVDQSGQPPQSAVVQYGPPPQSAVVQSYPSPQPGLVQFVPAPQPASAYYTNTVPAGYVSYDQLWKCIQKSQIANQQAANSPLAYILFPPSAKSC